MQKFFVLIDKMDVDLLETNLALALTDDYVFEYKNGLNFAIAFTGFDDNFELFDDPTIGQVVFNHFKWGENADGSTKSGRYLVQHHSCTR